MQIDITIKNYRCFTDSKPARIILRKGYTSFIGVNNSGKSSMLKFFYEFRHLFSFLTNPTGNLLDALKGLPQGFRLASSILDQNEIFCNLNNRNLGVELRFISEDEALAYDDPLKSERFDIIIPRGTSKFLAKLYSANGELILNEGSWNYDGTMLCLENNPMVQMSNLFEAFRLLSETLYIGPFRNAINMEANIDYFDIKVGRDFIQAWQKWKTGDSIEHNEAIIQLTGGIKHIFDFENLEINPSADGQTLKVFINEKSYKLLELGSGITQFILVLANVAIKQPSYILIDEPELNLHPSLQLDFLTTLGFYANEGVLFATHSIGLARACADWKYSFRLNAEGESEITEFESNPHLSEFIGELNFSGYRELGFDKILLVEGTTDVKTIQQFLRLYRKDHQIVILPLGGDSLINDNSEMELNEIYRISGNIFALIDSERSLKGEKLAPNREAFVKNCRKIGITCYVLPYRATENYFSEEAIKKVKGDAYHALEPYQLLKEASPRWSKTENWRIAREMTLEQLNLTDLGDFLGSL